MKDAPTALGLLAIPSTLHHSIVFVQSERRHRATPDHKHINQTFISRANCCGATTFAAGVDDLLEHTNRALGLTLERGEAAALVSILDVNGDNSIQCEELEVLLPPRCYTTFVELSVIRYRHQNVPHAQNKYARRCLLGAIV